MYNVEVHRTDKIKSKQTKFSNMEVLFIYINPNIE